MSDTFVCALCGEEYDKEWSDEESYAECKELFGVTPDEVECDVVCDDCFKMIRPDRSFTTQ